MVKTIETAARGIEKVAYYRVKNVTVTARVV